MPVPIAWCGRGKRAGAGRRCAEQRPFEGAHCTRGAARVTLLPDAVRPAAHAKNIRLTFQEASAGIVRGDPERLQSTREIVAAALEGARADVQAAASAREARDSLRQNVPALIIADLGMPVEDGFSLIRDVRKRLAPDVPAIALSAYADQRSREAALGAGFTAFLAKPTGVDALLSLVVSLLDLHDREGPVERHSSSHNRAAD